MLRKQLAMQCSPEVVGLWGSRRCRKWRRWCLLYWILSVLYKRVYYYYYDIIVEQWVWASTCRSLFTSSQRGVSGTVSSSTTCTTLRPTATTASQLHDTNEPTTYDTKTPVMPSTWNAVPSGPRRLTAVTSATYSGTAIQTAPTPMPVRNLSHIHTSCISTVK